MIKYGGVFLGTSLMASIFAINRMKTKPVTAENNITPEEALERLMTKNKRLVQNKQKNPN